ncbi:MAG: hypothetical protein CO064_03375 [Anaerolineae bacterium CG_4_9_14_0_8_um_filter_58_9]|nr:MAG: hypothetical protein CO064_03375 [Anaerolineae bacterium CG_4_9_14_0_8_um_filter_58_9]
MPRRETPFISDRYYHIYNRGNNRQAIFFQMPFAGRETLKVSLVDQYLIWQNSPAHFGDFQAEKPLGS